MKHFFNRMVGVVLLAALTSCSGHPDTVHVTLAGSAGMNPSPSGSSNPLALRVYLLSSPDKFQGADYFQLFDHEAATLGSELVARDEATVLPGQTTVVTIPTKPDARFVGIAASYRNIDKAAWRATVPIESNVRVALAADAVTAR
jgi:type VI secretion system protein VasD